MLKMNVKTFNPEILYVFAVTTTGPSTSKKHHHDFLEMSILVEGETFYTIENQEVHLKEETILLFNPGVSHHEQAPAGVENTQIHIGFRNVNLDRFPKDYFPVESPIIRLNDYNKDFFAICREIIKERSTSQAGYELMLKTLVMRLIVFLLRDKNTLSAHHLMSALTAEEQEKQQIVNEIILYLEGHYIEDITLNSLAQEHFISPANLSRIFKEETGDSPINHLIKIRLNQAKALMETEKDITVKEISHLVGYEDALYFSKLFKKYYGQPPSSFLQKSS